MKELEMGLLPLGSQKTHHVGQGIAEPLGFDLVTHIVKVILELQI